MTRILTLVSVLMLAACEPAAPEPVQAIQQALDFPPGWVQCTNYNGTLTANYVRVLLNTGACWEVNVAAQGGAIYLWSMGALDQPPAQYIVQGKSKTKLTYWYGMQGYNNPTFSNPPFCPWVECVKDLWQGNGTLLQGALVGEAGSYPMYPPSSMMAVSQ